MLPLKSNHFKFFGILLFFLMLLSCNQLQGGSSKEMKVLEGNLLNGDSGEPLVEVDVVLMRLNKPLFSMRGWVEIATTKTNSEGQFRFEFKELGPYELRWNPESNIVPHEYSVESFEGSKSVTVLHREKAEKSYPWSKEKGAP